MKTVSKITANGFETIDGCLYRNNLNVAIEDVLNLESNRHLATMPLILPARTVIYIPEERPKKKETINLWR